MTRARATRLALLIDGEAYFSTLAAALESATSSIDIVGWDIHSRVRLRPLDPSSELASLLSRTADRRPGLRVRVLCWDFAAIYAPQRELFTAYRMDWKTHPRVRFELDDRHPAGACHHQKIVVIDDRIAFIGGFDLTAGRWDRPDHGPEEPGRVDPDGRPYAPFHDVQTAVSGPAAAALGDIVRDRWRRATGERLTAPEPVDPGETASWPSGLEPDADDVDVELLRTQGPCGSVEALHEIESMYERAIEEARDSIYIENQFVTSSAIAAALEARLSASDPPEVVIVRPRRPGNWLEAATMGVLSDRVTHRLKSADRNGRLRVYCPIRTDLSEDAIAVHSKVAVFDDEAFTVGSANLTNRSMRLDTECNLLVRDTKLGSVLRARLLAEHLGCPPERFEQARDDSRSLIAAIEELRGAARTLEPIDETGSGWLDAVIPDGAPFDPERPVDAERFLALLKG